MASKVWDVMNDLEQVTTKIVSAREIIDAAINRIQEHQYDKAETMMCAAHEFLGYYLDEFDKKFKDAWQETVVKENDDKIVFDFSEPYIGYGNTAYSTCSPDDISEFCNQSWNNFWEEQGTIQDKKYIAQYHIDPAGNEVPVDKVVKWQLPVEMDPSGEYFVSFPDDLLEAADLKEGDEVYWIDNGDGSWILKKKK